MKNGDLPANVIFGRAGAEKMKHTAESLAAMPESGVNLTLAELLGALKSHKGAGDFYAIGDVLHCRSFDGTYVQQHPNYCRSYDAIMPLVFEHGISLITTDGGKLWFAEFDTEVNAHFILCSKISFQDPKPLRAAACCLILVLQETKGD